MRSLIGQHGRKGEALQSLWVRTTETHNEALPPGLPDGHDTQAFVDANGRPTNLHRCAAGSTITVSVDHDSGELAFGWATASGDTAYAARVVLGGFPATCVLRPWICVPGWCGGRLDVAPYHEHTPRALRQALSPP